MTTNLTISLTENPDGSINRAASLELFSMALDKHIEQDRLQGEVIGEAVRAVFDASVGVSLTLQTIQSLSCVKLNAQPENFKILAARVKEYMVKNSQGDDSLFTSVRGRNGGYRRREG